jgi:hypothetical protein
VAIVASGTTGVNGSLAVRGLVPTTQFVRSSTYLVKVQLDCSDRARHTHQYMTYVTQDRLHLVTADKLLEFTPLVAGLTFNAEA